MPLDVIAGPTIRILHCKDCGTLEEFPDFAGDPDHDVVLQVILSKHQTNGHWHQGQKVYQIEQRAWDLPNLRKSMIEQIRGGSLGLAAFDPQYYVTRDTFKEDALACFSQHLRPQEGCHDWHADSKRLLPDTRKARREVGLDMTSAPAQYLCAHCPVSAYYDRKRRGD